MGREYFGDISGKFGVAIQSSSDIENLINIEYLNEYEWYGCHCFIECTELSELNKKKFCDSCYDSFQQHYEEAKEDYDDLDEEDELYTESNTISYNIYKDEHYEKLIKNLNEIEKILPKDVVSEFKNIEENNELINGYSEIYNECYNKINKYNGEDNFKKKLELFLRYKLGFQVKYVLNTQDHCFLNCET